ncbi:mucin-5AC-like [Corythoichthys intestinalis]|uniref:mucin-5AC-like n=1 Tax=Corythoichthys intestinalis TaxID=161448 RepID=UPI0025A56C1A|nr:mucin-5AC-like [Corythoichthys intestinalis]
MPEPECWTPWFDRDNPGGKGDFEVLSRLRMENPMQICQIPIEIEVQTISGDSAYSTGETFFAFDTDNGFICRNEDQNPRIGDEIRRNEEHSSRGCSDYQVRFQCPLKFCAHEECWTPWFDRDDPTGQGDFETLSELHRENPWKICEHPIKIEVQTLNGDSVSSTDNVIYAADTETGFVCRNCDQPHNGRCRDYQVRFLCPLEFCRAKECWTEWFDRDNPTGTGDYESLCELRKEFPYKICPTPLQIEVETVYGFSVASTGDVIAVADTETGFICRNSDQKDGYCADYEVRFSCPLNFCQQSVCYTHWFNHDEPGGKGDYELLSFLRSMHPDICESPLSIEVVDASNDYPFPMTGQTPYV